MAAWEKEEEKGLAGEHLSATMSQLATAGILVTLLSFLRGLDRSLTDWTELFWLLYGPGIYGLNCLFLRRERSLMGVTLLNLLAGALAVGAAFFLAGINGIYYGIAVVFGSLVLTMQATENVFRGRQLSTTIQWLDGSLLTLAAFVAYLSANAASELWALPAVLGCAAAMLALVSLRAGGRMGRGGWGLLALLVGGLLGITWLGFRYVSRNLGQGVLLLWNALTKGIQQVAGLLYAGIEYLFSLLPETAAEGGELPAAVSTTVSTVAEETVEYDVPLFVYVLLALLVAGAVLSLLRRLKRERVADARVAVRRRRDASRSRPSFWDALRRQISFWRELLRLRLYLRRKRATVLGVYYGLLRKRAGGDWWRGGEKSPRQFLEELSAETEDGEEREALLALIPLAERALYSQEAPNPVYEQAKQLRLVGGRTPAKKKRLRKEA